jgi:hypothetical protein
VKINGWQRIGILASVVWMVGAFFYTITQEQRVLGQLNAELHASCFESANRHDDKAAWQACEDSSVRQMMSDLKQERVEAATVALVPVPLAWGFAYLALFLMRWVKRGFAVRK